MRIVGVLPRQSGVVAASDSDAGWMDPGLRASTSPTPSSRATSPASARPLASRPTTAVRPWSRNGRARAAPTCAMTSGSRSTSERSACPSCQRKDRSTKRPATLLTGSTARHAARAQRRMRAGSQPISARARSLRRSRCRGREPSRGAGTDATELGSSCSASVTRRRSRTGSSSPIRAAATRPIAGRGPARRSATGPRRCPGPWRVAGSRRGTTSWAGLGGLPGGSARRHGLRGRARRRAAAERRRRLSVPAGPPSPLLPSSARSPMWGRAPHPRHAGDRRPRRPHRSRRAPHRHRRGKPLR